MVTCFVQIDSLPLYSTNKTYIFKVTVSGIFTEVKACKFGMKQQKKYSLLSVNLFVGKEDISRQKRKPKRPFLGF